MKTVKFLLLQIVICLEKMYGLVYDGLVVPMVIFFCARIMSYRGVIREGTSTGDINGYPYIVYLLILSLLLSLFIIALVVNCFEVFIFCVYWPDGGILQVIKAIGTNTIVYFTPLLGGYFVKTLDILIEGRTFNYRQGLIFMGICYGMHVFLTTYDFLFIVIKFFVSNVVYQYILFIVIFVVYRGLRYFGISEAWGKVEYHSARVGCYDVMTNDWWDHSLWKEFDYSKFSAEHDCLKPFAKFSHHSIMFGKRLKDKLST